MEHTEGEGKVKTEDMIRALGNVIEEYKNKPVFTGQTDIPMMCRDVIDKLKELSNPWHTGTPTEEEIDEDNAYCYALCLWYDGWWLSDYLFKANFKEGCFESAPKGDEEPIRFKFEDDNPPFNSAMRWQKIESYKEEKEDDKEIDFPCLHCDFFDKGKCLNTDECKYDY